MLEIKIKKNYFQIFWFTVVRWLNGVFVFLSLRKSRKFWGVVYDSVSKQPLDPAIVKLVYAHSGEPVQTCVTDLAGRYGFLASPGKFKIFAKKSNYSFPSKRITHENDGLFTDVYKGEFFELSSESEVIGPNIPMDPIKPDWNQQEKLKVINTSPFVKLFFKRLVSVFFWFIFISASVLVIGKFLTIFRFPLNAIESKIFMACWGLFFLNALLPENRLWGKIFDSSTKNSIQNASFELTNPNLAGIILAKTQSQEDGRFLLRANPGKYLLTVKINDLKAEMPVIVHRQGVFNLNIKVLWINN